MPRPTLRRFLVVTMQTLLGPVIVLTLAIGGLAAFQRHFIYPMGYGGKPAPTAPASFTSVRASTPSGNLLIWKHKGNKGRPILLFLHGNATGIDGVAFVTRPFREAGWSVVAPEYPGYPGSTGSPSEKGLLDAARAGWRATLTDGHWPRDVVILGNSIGSGPAIALAAETNPRGLAIVSGVASLPQVIRTRLPFIPDLLVWDRYANAEDIHQVKAPVFVIHGTADDVVPTSQGVALARAAGTALVKVPGGHEIMSRSSVQQAVLHRFDR